MQNKHRIASSLALALGLAMSATAPAQNLVKNGDFDIVVNKSDGSIAGAADRYKIGGFGDSDFRIQDWNSSAYVAEVYPSGGGDIVDTTSYYKWWMFGPKNGVDNGMTDTSPAGGNYYAADGGWYAGPLTQQVNGMTVGQTYELSFWWAAAGLNTGGVGQVTAGWTAQLTGGSVDLAPVKVSTPTYDATGFVPWQKASFIFTALESSATLSFTPFGTNGAPPMSLLDGVSISAVPEASSWLLMLAGGLALTTMARRRAVR